MACNHIEKPKKNEDPIEKKIFGKLTNSIKIQVKQIQVRLVKE